MKLKKDSEKVVLKLNIQIMKIMVSGPIISWQIDRKTVIDFIFLGSKITADGDCSHEIRRCLLFGRKVMTNLDSIKQRHYFANKGPSSQGYGFSSGHVWMWELDYKESSAQKNWYFWTVVLEKTLESPLNCKEIQPVNPQGDQSWVFIRRTDVEAETPIFWPPDAKSWLIWKDSDAGKDWGQEEKGTTEDEMVGWHHRLNGHGFGWTLGVGDGQGGLACCGSRSCKELDTTEHLNWTTTQRSSFGSVVKNLPAMQGMQETQPQSLGQENPLEKEVATHSSILVLEIPWTEGSRELQSKWSQRVGHDWAHSQHYSPNQC